MRVGRHPEGFDAGEGVGDEHGVAMLVLGHIFQDVLTLGAGSDRSVSFCVGRGQYARELLEIRPAGSQWPRGMVTLGREKVGTGAARWGGRTNMHPRVAGRS